MIFYDDKIYSEMIKNNYYHRNVIEITVEGNGIDRVYYDRYDLFASEKINSLKANMSKLESLHPTENLTNRISIGAEFINANILKLV